MNQVYTKVFNWGSKYRIFHYDLCRKPELLVRKAGNMILHDDVVELNIGWLNEKPEELWRIYPLSDWDTELQNIISSFDLENNTVQE
jgi:hypothetical protein